MAAVMGGREAHRLDVCGSPCEYRDDPKTLLLYHTCLLNCEKRTVHREKASGGSDGLTSTVGSSAGY